MNKINLSIPEPCHENWEAMTSVEKGKFCNSCQKNVFDFTKASDREIINAYKKDNKLCGRFLETQLNRNLVQPKEKNAIWLATTSAIISFIGLGTQEGLAQENVKMEQTDKRIYAGKPAMPATKINLLGKIIDEATDEKLQDVLIQIKNKDNVIYSDDKGCFEVTAEIGDILVFSKKDFTTTEIPITSRKGKLTVFMESNHIVTRRIQVIAGGIGMTYSVKRRTFFGRIFHSIGNLFR